MPVAMIGIRFGEAQHAAGLVLVKDHVQRLVPLGDGEDALALVLTEKLIQANALGFRSLRFCFCWWFHLSIYLYPQLNPM